MFESLEAVLMGLYKGMVRFEPKILVPDQY
jgi:hypothetical protein